MGRRKSVHYIYKYKYLFSLLTSITDSAAFGKEITDLRKLFGNRVVVHLGKVFFTIEMITVHAAQPVL